MGRAGAGGRGGAVAVGKNKRLTKGKKGSKKKQVDPFTKKDWYDLKAPTMFATRTFGKTLVTRTQGTKTATDGLKGRKFDMCLADLKAPKFDLMKLMEVHGDYSEVEAAVARADSDMEEAEGEE